jgi:hypothetical protein
MEIKIADNHPGPSPGQVWDTAGWTDGVLSHQGNAGMQLAFIDPTGTTGSPPTSLTSSLPWPSLDTDDYQPNVGWALAGEGNLAAVSVIREIAFGDTDGDGQVVGLNFLGDFEALDDNYNKAANMYGDTTLVTLPDSTQVQAYPLGIATWRDGDFNVDGLVDKEDLELFNANFVIGNVNYDGQVNIFDIGTISDNWMTAGPQGDANADGEVNIFDVGEISDHWLDTEGAAQAVPEPASWLLLTLGMLTVAGSASVRRRSASR